MIWEPSWFPKTEPRRSKIDVEIASKLDQFLKASWNTICSAQEAPRRENGADPRRLGDGPAECAASGRGFGRGFGRPKPEIDIRNLALEGSGRTRRPGSNHLARRPRWAADRFAHSAGPGKSISLYPGPFLRPSAPRKRQLGTKKAKMGPTIRPYGVQRRQNRAKMVQRRGQNREKVG